jgi:hypothetical protein
MHDHEDFLVQSRIKVFGIMKDFDFVGHNAYMRAACFAFGA